MKTKKLIALALMGVMSCSVLAGCSQGKVAEKDGKFMCMMALGPKNQRLTV